PDNAKDAFVVAAGQTTPPAGMSALQLADIAATAVKLVLTPNGDITNSGSYFWDYSVPHNAFDFLAEGETLTFTYRITVQFTYQGVLERQVLDLIIVVTGTNDRPIIATDQQTQLIEFSAGTTTGGGILESLHNEATIGTFTFRDVDLTDTHKVSAVLSTASL